jgi:hypothetical protein
MRGRPRKEWNVERVRDLLLERPGRAIPVSLLKALVNAGKYPERWASLVTAMLVAPGFEGQGRMFEFPVMVDGVKSIVLMDRGY